MMKVYMMMKVQKKNLFRRRECLENKIVLVKFKM